MGCSRISAALALRVSIQIAKLVDYKQREEELKASDNPFAIVVQAHLAAQATKGKVSQQRRRKKSTI
jgi:hypothetical protein